MQKKIFFLTGFLILLFSHGYALAQFPLHLGGFILGDDIANYKDLVDMETFRKVPFNQYLKEGEIIPRPEFKSGIITYGLCDRPNKILKIKLKFADSSKKNYKQLLKRYKKQLGEPDEYKGDAFRTMIAWKWSFTNNNNEKTSLILQYNKMNEDEKIGAAVKFTLTSQIEKERACFMANSPAKKKKLEKSGLKGKALWDLLVPYY
ncbi:MAG: hypothetical protein GY857_16855 [Desulfobacula sp.]|nr:hypothetical protein [Desulfobacula sp.]